MYLVKISSDAQLRTFSTSYRCSIAIAGSPKKLNQAFFMSDNLAHLDVSTVTRTTFLEKWLLSGYDNYSYFRVIDKFCFTKHKAHSRQWTRSCQNAYLCNALLASQGSREASTPHSEGEPKRG